MGTDIHGVFQGRKDGKWVDLKTEYEFDRHYQLFAVLADVRNGYGFAGCLTGSRVEPIAMPRGLPADFECSQEYEEDGEIYESVNHQAPDLSYLPPWRQKYAESADIWMGDHSFSWLSGKEMLAWYENAPSVTKYGIMSRENYENWDKTTEPPDYCGSIWGKDLITIPESEIGTAEDYTHVQASWQSPLKIELKYFFDEIKRLLEDNDLEPEDLRLVFGFDS
jgi:hypothetical protein